MTKAKIERQTYIMNSPLGSATNLNTFTQRILIFHDNKLQNINFLLFERMELEPRLPTDEQISTFKSLLIKCQYNSLKLLHFI